MILCNWSEMAGPVCCINYQRRSDPALSPQSNNRGAIPWAANFITVLLDKHQKPKEPDVKLSGFLVQLLIMIIDHTHKAYRLKWANAGKNKFNGAFYYSKEIVENIIPNVETDRNWITVNIPGVGCDHAVVFIHNNKHPENYEWLKRYKDLILVCGIPETVEKVAHLGHAIYLPLSVDVDYVKQFRVEEKTKEIAFVGRPAKRKDADLPDGVDYIEALPRPKMLEAMAQYKTVYAVGRCAIEAKILNCRLKAYDPRFPKVSRWKVFDNKDAAKKLQEEIDRIDGKGICS